MAVPPPTWSAADDAGDDTVAVAAKTGIVHASPRRAKPCGNG